MQYQEYMLDAQEQIKQRIVETAYQMFLQNGIESVKMTDVAKQAEVGVASVYRYFGTKRAIVIRSGELFWNNVAAYVDHCVQTPSYCAATGLKKAHMLLEIALRAYCEKREFLLFLHRFDAFLLNEKASHAELTSYENSILQLREVARRAFDDGALDGSIRADLDFDAFYFTATHALLSLGQKLVCGGDVLQSDRMIDGAQQITMLIDMMMEYVKARK